MLLFQVWFTPLGFVVHVSLLERIHVLIFDFSRKNTNIRSDSLCENGLHLNDKEKTVLADNFIVYLNNNTFLETHIHHPSSNF